ncbi:OmpL47-type beta-barrel domain-containing protein [Microbacterium pumilum]|uniref:Arabinogalactan endo-beta-1,4-galactanase n=1 Tax=Microbacterium pumilum TaxID=344165 RepID=A0ABP5D0N8_9MICO
MSVKEALRSVVTGIALAIASVLVVSSVAAAETGSVREIAFVPLSVGMAGANLDFEGGLTGWDTTGAVTSPTSGAQDGSRYAALPANATAQVTITGLQQGSYSLTGWFRGSAGNNVANITVSGSGGPNSVMLLDANLSSTAWQQTSNRNVLVYSGEVVLTITAGSTALSVDTLELTLDSADESLANWGFESGLDDWSANAGVTVVTDNADTGEKAVKLAAGGQVAQQVAVEPNTRYGFTVRAKVDEQDTFSTEKTKDSKDRINGELVHRESTGDRVNIGVKTLGGTVLRQAPAGTTGYSLVSITFETGPDDHAVVLYANTINDAAYQSSVTVWKTEGSYVEDPWTGNGAGSAYVDTADLFVIHDDENIRGADVSFMPAIEDKGGKYFANGVQQDGLRILSNHGVNSIISMIFVQAGNTVYDNNTLEPIYSDQLDAAGNPIEYRMIEGYFDKVHTTRLAQRASQLGISYMPSFHYSDSWISAGKAYAPSSWINTDYAGKRTNTDLAHIKSIVYNYVYDFVSGLVAAGVDIAGVKQGNEQDGGLIWPIGRGAASVGHASIITATWDAVEAAAPGTARSIHSNNGYDVPYTDAIFNNLTAAGAKFDGESHSLYGGRSSGNIIKMATVQNADPVRRYRDYLNVETGFAFTKYLSSFDQQVASMGQSAYYRSNPNGQYNWILDYQQAALDTPNPYGQTRGFYYWETDWIPTPGAGSSQTSNANVAGRIMFNNGDVTIKEMGSTRSGKAGDMMDSMYGYLWRGLPKAKPVTAYSPLSSDNGIAGGAYAVTPTVPTGISVADSAISLTVGLSQRLKPTVTPVAQVLTDSTVRYSSSDPAVASVTHNGYVKALAPGSTTVTARDAAGHIATVSVTVSATTKATNADLAVTAGTTTVADGGTVTAAVLARLDLTATLANATTKVVTYKSSDPTIASFFGETWQTPVGTMKQRTDDSSKVQLDIKRAGTTTITVTSADGGATKSFTLNTTKVAVTSITLNKTSATVSNSRKLQLVATIAPANATLYKVNWTSSNPAVAKVDKMGMVTAVAPGTATIRAESDDSTTMAATSAITVVPVQVEGVVLNKTSLTVQTGSTKPLSALVLPEDADNKSVTWSTSDPAIATVGASGAVTGVHAGTAIITATTAQGGFTAHATVTVQTDEVAVTGITLDRHTHFFASDYFSTVNPGTVAPTIAVSAAIAPIEATKDTVIWKSDTPTVATVNSFGIITAVSAGVATITASSEDGLFHDSITVYVPTISDSFDNRTIGDTWSTGRAANYSGVMNAAVIDSNGDQVLAAVGSGSGGRGGARYISPAVKNDLVILDFDWHVGQPTGTKGAFLTIADSTESRYLGIQYSWATELVYASGGKSGSTSATTNEPLANTTPVGTGFNVNNVWYKVHVEIDMIAKQSVFTITRKDNPAITATHTVPFAADTVYNGNVASLQWWTTRAPSATMSWTTMLDDVNIYKAAPIAKTVTVNSTGIRFIPITGTRMTQFQLSSGVVPTTISQNVTYTSANTNLVTVTSSGLVTPAHLYSSLNTVVSGTTTVRVASAVDPTVYVDVPVTVTNEIRASEFFWVEDSDGDYVYEEGESGSTIPLDVGDEDQLVARLTGGDGATDVADIEWKSTDPSVVEIDSETGELTAIADGVATVNVTVSLYTGEPKTAAITFRVGPAPTASSIAVTHQPTKTTYQVGEELVSDGLEVTATLTDGSTTVLEADEYTISGFSSAQPGTDVVVVTLKSDETKKTGFTVTIATPDTTAPVVVATVNPASPTGLAGWYTGAVGVTLSATDDAGVASIEYRVGADGAWTDYEAQVAAPEGATAFGYRATDTKGNVSAVQTVTVQRDEVGPAAAAAFDDADGTTEGPVAVTLSATDAASGVDTISYSVDGGTWLTYSGPVSVSGAGEHVVTYRAIDVAGNVGSVKTATVSIVAADTTAPIVAASLNPASPTGDAGWYVGAVALTLTATDDRSGIGSIQYTVGSGTWTTYTGPVALDEGSMAVSYRATDGKGNVSDQESLTVKRDDTAPAVSADFDDHSGASTGPVAVTLSATDAGSGVGSIAYTLDGGAWTTYTTPLSVTGAGTHTVAYEASDAAGNVSAVSTATIQIAVADTVAPVVTAVAAPAAPSGLAGWYAGAVSVTLSAVDERSGIASIEYRANGGSWTVYTSPVVIPEGIVEVEYRATDTKGNVSAPDTITVKRDVTAPVSAASFDDQDGQATGPVEVVLTSTDGGSGVSGVTYSVNGGASTLYTGVFEVATNATITFAATDRAGNVEATKSAAVVFAPVDSTPPVVTGTTTPAAPNGANGWFTSPVTLTLTATDTQSGVDSITYRAGSGAFTTYSTPIAVPVGSTTYTFRATDGKGNVSGFKTVTVKRDEDAPVASSTAAATTATSATVTVIATDVVSGVASISYRIDSGSWKTYTTPFVITGAGVHTVEFAATDPAGNAGTIKSSQVLVGPDTSAPLLTVATNPTSPDGANGWFTSAVTVSAAATDVSGVAKTEYRVGTGAWAAYTAPISAPAGTTTYGFRATDAKGNVSAIKTVTVKRDNTLPVTAASFNDLGGAGSDPVKVTLSRTDTFSGIGSTWYQIDGGTWTQYSAAFYVEGAGDRVVAYATTDLAGNTETVKTVTVRIASPDTTAPVLVVTTTPEAPTGLNSWFTGTVSLKATATDPAVPSAATAGVKSIEYRVGSGAWTIFSASIAAPVGTTTYSFRATDKAGNVSATHSVVVKRDTVVPVASATYTNGGVGTVPVTLNATDATSGVGKIVYSLDQGPWTTYDAVIPVTGAGSHTLYYSAIDNAGNTSATRTATITVVAPDTTGPTVSAVTSPAAPTGTNGWFKGTAAVSLSLVASDSSGVASREYQVNGGAWKPYTAAISVPAGETTFTYRATDNRGNVSTIGTIVIKRDTAAPVATAAFTNSQVGTVPVTLTATDALSGVAAITYSLDQGAWTAYTGPIPVTGKGTHTISYTATDKAGNVSAAKSASITVK